MSESIDIPPQFPISRANYNTTINTLIPYSYDDVLVIATTSTSDTYQYSYKGQAICTLLVTYTAPGKAVFLRATRTDLG